MPQAPNRSTRALCASVALFALVGLVTTALAGESRFPFDQQLLLDSAPLHGSKRIPSIEVGSNGAAAIDLWCGSGNGHVALDGPSITIIPHSVNERPCAPDRAARDSALLDSLSQVTTWRRDGDGIVLIGPQTFRYRPASN